MSQSIRRAFLAFLAGCTLIVPSLNPATAYPGFGLVSSASTTPVGQSLSFYAVSAPVSCSVTFTQLLDNRRIASRTAIANNSGQTSSVSFAFSKLGSYTVTATHRCAGFRGSDSENVLAGSQTSTDITNVSRSARGFAVSGRVTANSTGVKGMRGTVSVTDITGRSFRTSVRTDDAGNFTGSVRISRFVVGTYAITVSFSNSQTHFGSSDSTTN